MKLIFVYKCVYEFSVLYISKFGGFAHSHNWFHVLLEEVLNCAVLVDLAILCELQL